MSRADGAGVDRKAKAREYQAKYRQGLSDEARAAIRARNRAKYACAQKALTEAEREARRQRKREYDAARRKENPEKRRAESRERCRQWRHNNPEKAAIITRRRNLKLYGLTQESYRAIYEKQGGKCRICAAPVECIDHDHATGKVRGLLCGNCNTGLGRFRDSVDHLKNAIAYLEQHNAVA